MRHFNVKVNGQQYFVEIEETESHSQFAVKQSETAIEKPVVIKTVEKPLTQKAAVTDKAVEKPAAQKKAGATVIKAPMPGLILSWLVDNGAIIKKNERILLIEAMKMEHDIVSPIDGKVTFIAKKGDNVETGVELAFIE